MFTPKFHILHIVSFNILCIARDMTCAHDKHDLDCSRVRVYFAMRSSQRGTRERTRPWIASIALPAADFNKRASERTNNFVK